MPPPPPKKKGGLKNLNEKERALNNRRHRERVLVLPRSVFATVPCDIYDDGRSEDYTACPVRQWRRVPPRHTFQVPSTTAAATPRRGPWWRPTLALTNERNK